MTVNLAMVTFRWCAFPSVAIRICCCSRQFGILIRPFDSFTAEFHKQQQIGKHGFRHAHSQAWFDRFLALTRFRCQQAGGPGRKSMTPEQREFDWEARLVLTEELGREQKMYASEDSNT